MSLDLTGLPPRRREIRRFLNDTSAGDYAGLVDPLLATSKYGEHMAKYGLDLVRFADTNGIHNDRYREMRSYRDWIIRAFNQHLPHDQFDKYQLADDLFSESTHDQLVASGFNRLHLIIDGGTALPDDTIVVFAGEFGRTVYCQGKLEHNNYGRDHHPRCFSAWMAGGGIQEGILYGATDDFSYNVVQDPVAVCNLHATILHQLGIDHEKLTVPFQGLDHQLTGVEEAHVIGGILG